MKKNTKDNQVEQTMIHKAHQLQTRKNIKLNFNSVILGTFGRQISFCVILGIISGKLLDKHYPIDNFSWTLNCILLGFIFGILQVYNWLKKNGFLPPKNKG